MAPHITIFNSLRSSITLIVSFLVRGAFALIILLILVLAVMASWLHTDAAQQKLATLATRTLAEETGYQLGLGTVTYTFPLGIHISSLTLADKEGIWLTAKEAGVILSPASILGNHIFIHTLNAKSINLSRLPKDTANNESNNSDINLAIGAVDIGETVLETPVTGLDTPVTFSLKGNVAWKAKQQHFRFELTSRLLNPNLPPFKFPDANLSGYYDVTENRLFLNKASIQAEPFHASGSAIFSFNNQSLESHIDFSSTLDALIPDIRGNIDGEAKIIGSLSSPSFKITAHAKDINYQSHALSSLQAETEINYKEGSWQGNFSAHTGSPDLSVQTDFSWQTDQALRLFNTLILSPRYSLSTELTWNQTAHSLALHIKDSNLDGIKLSAANIEALALSSTTNDWSFKGSAKGDYTSPFSLQTKGLFSLSSSESIKISLSELRGNYGQLPWMASGVVSGTVLLKGNTTNPEVFGNLVVKEGKYANPGAGVNLRDIKGIISGQGQEVSFNNWQARDSKGNLLKAEGHLSVHPDMPFDATLNTTGFHLLEQSTLRGVAKANLTLTGDLKGATLSGTIIPGPLEIRIPEKFNTSLPQLNVVDSITRKKQKRIISTTITPPSSAPAYPLSLNIAVSAKQQIYVRGWGVDAELSGDLNISGKVTNPQIQGKLDTIRGRYEEFGKQFTITQGTLLFEGSIPPSPYLTIIGSSTSGDTEVRLVLSGPLLTPGLTIESTPSLPQDEAMSRLLFGKEARSISPFQAVQLANSLRRLAGYSGGGFDPLDTARNLLGVDTLNVENSTTDPKSSALGVGKHVNKNIYLELERGSQSGTGKAKIELDVTPNISVESTTGERGQTGVGINWKRDY